LVVVVTGTDVVLLDVVLEPLEGAVVVVVESANARGESKVTLASPMSAAPTTYRRMGRTDFPDASITQPAQ
jgi:hypothetical protein